MTTLFWSLALFGAALLGAAGAWLWAHKRSERQLSARTNSWQKQRTSMEGQTRRLEGEIGSAHDEIELLKDQLAACEWKRKSDVEQLATATERADKLAAELLSSRSELASVVAARQEEAEELVAAQKRLRQLTEAVEIGRAAVMRQRNEKAAAEQRHAAENQISREQLEATRRALQAAERRLAELGAGETAPEPPSAAEDRDSQELEAAKRSLRKAANRDSRELEAAKRSLETAASRDSRELEATKRSLETAERRLAELDAAAAATAGPDETPEPAEATAAKPAEAVAAQPARKPAARPRPKTPERRQATAKRDDLKRIHGVGPSLERQLHAAGIRTFHQIAAWDSDYVARDTNGLSAFRTRILRDDWIGQARELCRDSR